MCNDNNQSYRRAIVLNNIGVSLLERRCFQAASETLKDATAFIKSTLNANSTKTRDSSAAVHLARQRLADASNLVHKNSRNEDVQVEVFTNNNLRSKSIQSFSEETATPKKVYAILIEDSHCNGANSKESLTAIMLFNLGVAYHSVAKATRTNKSRKGTNQYSNGAMRLFRIAHSLFSKTVTGHKNSKEVPEPLHVMALVVLNTLIIQTLYDLQRPEVEARPFLSMLQHLRTWTLKEAAFGLATSGAAAAA